MKKHFKTEHLLYLFILISPLLDIISSLFNNGSFSISLFLRPIIPVILLLYIFFKNKDSRKDLLIMGTIYLIYFACHIYIYKGLILDGSFGSLTHEASYILNYSYLIFLLYLFYTLFKDKDKKNLYKVLIVYTCIYIGSIYISILSGTSLSTYLEGTGYKGWFNTGGAVGSILIGSMFILLPYLFKNKEKIIFKCILTILVFGYLIFLLGTRVGLLGGILCIGCYLFFTFFLSLLKKVKINKKVLFSVLGVLLIVVVLLISFGSSTIKRRQELKDLNGKIPDSNSNEVIYMAYDTVKLRDDIILGKVPYTFLSKEQQKSILDLDEYAKKVKMASTDQRTQQLMYHHYLYKNQSYIIYRLFGNGYLTNPGLLTLEMEVPALFYNFGIFGLVVFFGPFLYVFFYSIYKGIKNIKKIDINYLMLLAGTFTLFMISFLSGHTYFNTSVMIVVVVMNILLYYEANKLEE